MATRCQVCCVVDCSGCVARAVCMQQCFVPALSSAAASMSHAVQSHRTCTAVFKAVKR